MGLVDAWGGNAIGWFFAHLIEAYYNIFYAITHPGEWLAWVPHIAKSGRLENREAAESLMRFIYYGGSVELFFAVFAIFLTITGIGIARRPFMWGCVRGLEWFANRVGRIAAWAGLLMVLQQILIIFMQRVFAVSEITIGFGKAVTHDVSGWAEMLKLENAIIVTLCASYTFVQGGHVRVDLVYSAISHRAKRIIDMCGALLFMVPAAVLTWMYGWFFLWRHLITPKPAASNSLDQLVNKARAVRWNVETIGFSPNGFNGYYLFKILLVAFCALILLQAVAFFYRSYLELVEDEEAANKHLDKDDLGDEQAELVADIH